MAEFIIQYWLQAFFGLVIFVLVKFYRRLEKRIVGFFEDMNDRFNKIDNDLEDSKYSDKVLLEDRLLQAHRYYTQKEYCTVTERRFIEKLHIAYKKVGGNGTMDEIIRDICDLPFKPPGD